MSTPWYRDGLKFGCTQCGRCCTGAPGYVWVTRTEIDRLASWLEMSPDEFGGRYVRRVGRRYSLIEKPNGDCIFYDRGCTVYSARPNQCRTYPFWPEILKSRKAWDEEAQECPGVGTGHLYSLEDIQVIRRPDGETSGGS